MHYRKGKIFIVIVFCTSILSCKKYLDVNPPTNQLGSDQVFENDATATGAISGIYSEMMNNSNQFTNNGTTLYTGMLSDELYYYTAGTRDEFEENEITEVNHSLISSLFWVPAYKYIYMANISLEKLEASSALTPAVKRRLSGECKFIRAFCYLQLTSLFGDVPLIVTPDYRMNSVKERTPIQEIYLQIENDLKEAKEFLQEDYATSERARPNKWAAAALLARAYLYKGEWAKAEDISTEVINAGPYLLLSNLNQVFLKASQESIWQLQPVNPTRNTWEGNIIIPATNNSIPTYLVTPSLLNSFEAGDLRMINWVKSRVYSAQTLYYPYKYKVQTGSTVTEHYIVLRLAEQYLIRAEARAQNGETEDAVADINVIRSRAGLAPLQSSISKEDCLLAVEQERRIELFSEWGHRWYDLKRTNRADVVLETLKPATWESTDKLLPIPINQINLNGALQQNPGY